MRKRANLVDLIRVQIPDVGGITSTSFLEREDCCVLCDSNLYRDMVFEILFRKHM